MSIFFPDIALNRVTEITPSMLQERNIKGLILDIDNTLTHHNSQTIDPDVLEWLTAMREKYSCILLSNNHEDRVAPFGTMLGMDFLSNGAKPLPKKGLAAAAEQLGLPPSETAMIGDQLFTDVLGGNLFGATTIRVEPMQTEGGWFFHLKRFAENFVMKRYYKRRAK